MKKIGLLISTMNSGGAERVVSHLTHILSAKYDVHLILFEDTFMEYTCAGTLHTLDVPAKAGNPFVKLQLLFRRVQALKRLIREEKLSCVISFLDSPNFVNLLGKVPGCRKVISIRNYSELENSTSLLGKLADAVMKQLYHRADCVVTVSQLIEKSFREYYRIPAQKLRTIYNPYDFQSMREKEAEALSEDEAAFFQDKFVFANVGRIMHQKGIWHLVKAFSLVRKTHPQAGLVIVGEDFTEGKMERLIDELELKDSILLTGRSRNPYRYLRRADCYVLSSLFEGFPNAMVEAMACGCAVVAADCKSGPREILYETPDLASSATDVTEADYGIIVPPLEDTENWESSVITDGERAMARAMERLLADPAKCRQLAQKAEDRSHTFDFDAARQAFGDAIEGR